MLISDPVFERPTGILALLSAVNGMLGCDKELATGIYEISHFGSSDFPGKGWLNWQDEREPLSVDEYGVCDSWEQILERCPDIAASETRKFCITLTEVRRDDQPHEGGWRWHKWGPYIGTHDPQCEYLHDEKGIERVFVYHIYEKRP